MSKYFFAVLLVWHVLSLSDGSAVGVGGNTGFLVKTAIFPVSAAALSPVSSAPEKQLASAVRLSGRIRAFTVLLAASLLLCVTAVTVKLPPAYAEGFSKGIGPSRAFNVSVLPTGPD